MEKLKILITGANGFIGSHIAERFLKEGHTVRCLAHRNTDRLNGLKQPPGTTTGGQIEIYRGSVTQPETLAGAVRDIDFIFHSAAVLRVVHAETYYDVNHAGTKNLIEATRQHNPKIKRFVYISSQAAMGPSESCAPRTASSNCAPVSDYGRSKLLGEEEALKFSDRIPVTILRPSAVYGPGDKDLLLFFRLANRGFFPVLSPCKGGECFVQLVFVDDIAEVCLLLLTRKPANTTYFVSQNTPYTWKQVGEIISRAVNKKLFFFKLPAGVLNLGATISETFMKLKGQPANLNRDKATELCQPYWIADSSITEKEFGFNFTPLEKGVEITYNWYRQNKWV